MKRDTTQTIWRTVVFAGAMLGTQACHTAKPVVAPTNTAPTTKADPPATQQTQPPSDSPDPCAGVDPPTQAVRPRGLGADRPVGRGFVLS